MGKAKKEGLSFDDVLVMPNYSDVVSSEVELSTRFSKEISLRIPLVSSPMDMVTESQMAIRLAELGGIGVIHRLMSPEEQAAEVRRVKKHKYGVISNPVTISPKDTVGAAKARMNHYHISGLPVVEDGKLVGIITNRDVREEDIDSEKLVCIEMTARDRLHVLDVDPKTDWEQLRHLAKEVMNRYRVEKVPIVDHDFNLKGLLTHKDVEDRHPYVTQDKYRRLGVAAAVGTNMGDLEKRLELLMQEDVDAVVIDTAHGHHKNMATALAYIIDEKKKTGREYIQIVAGNVCTAEATEYLIKLGADAVRVGIGPGSICTTRIVAGAGMPQISAILDCAGAAAAAGVPIIADGGIKYSGDITKALAAGADCVMLGNLFAGTDESPGEIVQIEGRAYKKYRGMGSLGAMTQGSDRYEFEVNSRTKSVPEGIEGRVPFRGPLERTISQLLGGLSAGMGYAGCRNIAELKENARFVKITQAGLRESHPHGVFMTEEPPNYQSPG